MVAPWMLWTDGSCKHHSVTVAERRPGALRPYSRGPGGWAAIVEHGSTGYVVKGRVERTTNVRMELLAAVMALREVPAGADAILHTDCTTVLLVEERWRRRLIDAYRGADRGLWNELAASLARLGEVEVRYLEKKERDYRHMRAHLIAGSEATAAYLGYDPPLGPRVRLALGHSVVARI